MKLKNSHLNTLLVLTLLERVALKYKHRLREVRLILFLTKNFNSLKSGILFWEENKILA